MNQRPHEKLTVWKESFHFVKDIYEMTRTFPDSERYGLISQLHRAAVSVPANIAEGAARRTRKEYLQFLYISRGSLSEIDTLLQLTFSLKMTEASDYDRLRERSDLVGKLLTGLIKSLRNS